MPQPVEPGRILPVPVIEKIVVKQRTLHQLFGMYRDLQPAGQPQAVPGHGDAVQIAAGVAVLHIVPAVPETVV